MNAQLSSDPLWPRTGDWPSPDEFDPAERIDLALLGIPTWRTSLSGSGAGGTPQAVRDALRFYCAFESPDGGDDDINRPKDSREPAGESSDEDESERLRPERLQLPDLRFADFGDVDDPDGAPGEARALALMADAVDRSEIAVALGGDNALTVPAALGAWGDELDTAGLITLDAHHDLRDGESNGSPVRRLIEAGLDGKRVVQIGIADFANSAQYAARARDYGITVIHRDELERRSMEDIMADALEIAGSAGGPVHVDLDVDVCDRSVAPACPASIPGGITAFQLRRAARAAGAHPHVRSVDLAEVDVTRDTADQRTIRLCALLVLEVAAGLTRR
jgi:formiminoglutamase